MAFDLSEISHYADLVAANPEIQRTLWGPSIDMDARDSNPMKDFIGGEKVGQTHHRKERPRGRRFAKSDLHVHGPRRRSGHARTSGIEEQDG